MNGKKHGVLRSWLPVFLWMLLIFCLSLVPGNRLPKISIPNISSLVHVLEYAVLGALLFRGFANSMPEKGMFLISGLAFLAAIFFAASDELHQSFVPGRFCDVWDFIVDVFAALLAILWQIRRWSHSALKNTDNS